MILAGMAGGLDPHRRPWAAAMLAELDEAATGSEALLWAIGGLRVAWLERSRRSRATGRAAVRRRPAVLAALSGLSAAVTAVLLLPVPGRALAGPLAGSLPPGRPGAAHGDVLVLAGLALALLLVAVLALSAAVAIGSGRVRLAGRLLAIAAVLGLVPAPWVGLLAAAARRWLTATTRRGLEDAARSSAAG